MAYRLKIALLLPEQNEMGINEQTRFRFYMLRHSFILSIETSGIFYDRVTDSPNVRGNIFQTNGTKEQKSPHKNGTQKKSTQPVYVRPSCSIIGF